MKVESVEAHSLRVKMDEDLRGGSFAYSDFQASLVKVVCDGVEGWGEAMSRSDPRVNSLLVEHLGKGLVGKDFRDVGSAWEEVWRGLRVRGHTRGTAVEALSGIEIALQDCAGKLKGKSIAEMLGGGSKAVPALAGSIMESRGPLETQVEKARAKGLGGAKVKTGFGPEEDFRILSEVRRRWPEARLVADANGAYDSATARKVCKAVSGLGLSWFEEPVLSDDIEGYRSLVGSGVRIGGGESWFVSDFGVPISEALIGVVEPSVSRCGGIGVEARVASDALKKGIAFSPMVGMNSGVSLAASVQLASVYPGEGVEYNPFTNPLQTELVSGLGVPKDGSVSVPDGPGLGIEIDLRFLRKHSLDA